MKITAIQDTVHTLSSDLRNAGIRFDAMTASALVVVTDCLQNGRLLCGLAFDSIGRYAHSGLLRERFIPRLLDADPLAYQDPDSGLIDPLRAWSVMMQNEKPGGHGERAGAVGILDAALWDLVAKAENKPLFRLLGERFNAGLVNPRVPVYASGGHYRSDNDIGVLKAELSKARDNGHTRFKIKIGDLSLAEDLRRIEAAISVVGKPGALAVDANSAWDSASAYAYLDALTPYRLAWIEEPVDPLDFELYNQLSASFPGPFACGENLFSFADTRNLLRYGGLRPQRDLLQMDISLSYGIPEYVRIIDWLETNGWSRRQCWPHAGHLFALHAAAGLGLGGHETAMADNHTLPFAGFAADSTLDNGIVTLGNAAGVGFEQKAEFFSLFRKLIPT